MWPVPRSQFIALNYDFLLWIHMMFVDLMYVCMKLRRETILWLPCCSLINNVLASTVCVNILYLDFLAIKSFKRKLTFSTSWITRYISAVCYGTEVKRYLKHTSLIPEDGQRAFISVCPEQDIKQVTSWLLLGRFVLGRVLEWHISYVKCFFWIFFPDLFCFVNLHNVSDKRNVIMLYLKSFLLKKWWLTKHQRPGWIMENAYFKIEI